MLPLPPWESPLAGKNCSTWNRWKRHRSRGHRVLARVDHDVGVDPAAGDADIERLQLQQRIVELQMQVDIVERQVLRLDMFALEGDVGVDIAHLVEVERRIGQHAVRAATSFRELFWAFETGGPASVDPGAPTSRPRSAKSRFLELSLPPTKMRCGSRSRSAATLQVALADRAGEVLEQPCLAVAISVPSR